MGGRIRADNFFFECHEKVAVDPHKPQIDDLPKLSSAVSSAWRTTSAAAAAATQEGATTRSRGVSEATPGGARESQTERGSFLGTRDAFGYAGATTRPDALAAPDAPAASAASAASAPTPHAQPRPAAASATVDATTNTIPDHVSATTEKYKIRQASSSEPPHKYCGSPPVCG